MLCLQRFLFFIPFCFYAILIVFCHIFVPYLYRNLKGDEMALMDTYDTLMNKNGRWKD